MHAKVCAVEVEVRRRSWSVEVAVVCIYKRYCSPCRFGCFRLPVDGEHLLQLVAIALAVGALAILFKLF